MSPTLCPRRLATLAAGALLCLSPRLDAAVVEVLDTYRNNDSAKFERCSPSRASNLKATSPTLLMSMMGVKLHFAVKVPLGCLRRKSVAKAFFSA